MSTVLDFKDFGFKLAVIDHLMYKSNVLTPQIRAQEFIEQARGLEKGAGYDVIEEEGYELLPELKTYFEQLEITDAMVADITELYSDGGDEIYLELIPFWDGEDDAFDVTSAEDVRLLPNLKNATLLFEYPGEELIQAFEAQGVTLESI